MESFFARLKNTMENSLKGGGQSEDLMLSRPPETEQECLEYYQQRITNSQAKQLLPLQEDLADWINKILGFNHVTASNFLDSIDNGVVLCHLAEYIHQKADDAYKSGLVSGNVPVIKGPFFERASRKSFFSRDNIDKFIKFCKQIGVHENLLFETNDLVQQKQPRNVILCLMEVARIATRYNVEPPGLVALEKEIAEEESGNFPDWHFQPIRRASLSSSEGGLWCETWKQEDDVVLIQEGGCGVGEGLRRAPSERSVGGGSTTLTSPAQRWSPKHHTPTQPSIQPLDQLDLQVKSATKALQKQCRCTGENCGKLQVTKVGEGRYNISGRNVFVRLLKGRHMMVRVGGGWDTLEHFLERHDPCQSRSSSRPSTPAAGKTRPYSALHSYHPLHAPTHSPHSLAR